MDCTSMRVMDFSRTSTSLFLSSPPMTPPAVDEEPVPVVEGGGASLVVVAAAADDVDGGGTGLLLGVIGDGVRLPPASERDPTPPPPMRLKERMQKLDKEVSVPYVRPS